ncbi:hypothetical protein JTE90_003553 [Oedothorax gibbosus]|uniref:Uncharacterized protein n=1 Tax=Oedothorax gibbosus TaxID=931172 RepID=A0AAV6VK62_9ARAC|nr:hypothetical protein JTE90_003553 [Oedothorax gibbosus]
MQGYVEMPICNRAWHSQYFSPPRSVEQDLLKIGVESPSREEAYLGNCFVVGALVGVGCRRKVLFWRAVVGGCVVCPSHC